MESRPEMLHESSMGEIVEDEPILAALQRGIANFSYMSFYYYEAQKQRRI
jgi:hypothetical protein